MVNAGGNDRCEELGVYGVVTGMVGTGMASEVIKLLIRTDGMSLLLNQTLPSLMDGVGRVEEADGIDTEPLLHLLHLGGNPLIRTIRIRAPSPKCEACGPDASIRVEEFDYDTFCVGPSSSAEGDYTVPEIGDRIGVEVSTCLSISSVSMRGKNVGAHRSRSSAAW